MNTPEWEALRAFRQEVYASFGCRRDALFEASIPYEAQVTRKEMLRVCALFDRRMLKG